MSGLSVIKRHRNGAYLFVNACHTRACPYWRIGKRHGPCVCGAIDLLEDYARRMREKSPRQPASRERGR